MSNQLTLSYSVSGQGKFTHSIPSVEKGVEIFQLHRDGRSADGTFSFNDFGSRDLSSNPSIKDGKKVIATISYNGQVTTK